MKIEASFHFSNTKQLAEWVKYLNQKGETHQEALMNLIDEAIKHNKDLNMWFKTMNDFRKAVQK